MSMLTPSATTTSGKFKIGASNLEFRNHPKILPAGKISPFAFPALPEVCS